MKEKLKKKIAKFPNPLFLCWLEEWKSEARAKDNTNLAYVYSKAITLLKKYPTVIELGRACLSSNFGPKTCKMLDDRLAKHRAWLAENEDLVSGRDEAPTGSGMIRLCLLYVDRVLRNLFHFFHLYLYRRFLRCLI